MLPLYPAYGDSALAFGLTAVEDQTIAGLIMKLGGTFCFWFLMTMIWFRWVVRKRSGTNRRRSPRPPPGAIALVACTQAGGTYQGVVVAVEGDLTEVSSFTLLVEGDQLTFVPVPEATTPIR